MFESNADVVAAVVYAKLFMNAMAPIFGSPFMAVAVGMVLSVVLGAAFGLAHGLLITKGRIHRFLRNA